MTGKVAEFTAVPYGFKGYITHEVADALFYAARNCSSDARHKSVFEAVSAKITAACAVDDSAAFVKWQMRNAKKKGQED